MEKTREKKKLKNLNSQRAITLIALVVTIVVLLILAGVSLNLVLGNNGIINKAKEAVDKYGEAAENEQKELNNLKDWLEGSLGEVDDNTPGDITDGGSQDGSNDKPYKIRSIEDYLYFIQETRDDSKVYNSFVELETDLDFKDPNSYNNPNDTQLFGDYNYDGKTEGIMQELTDENQRGVKNGLIFSGTFDGKGHTIRNIHMQDTLKYYAGGTEDNDSLIAIIQENRGIIKNLNLQGKISAKLFDKNNVSMYIGGIAAQNEYGGQIINCTSDIEITVTADNLEMPEGLNVYIGGIAGTNEDINENTKIDGCSNKGTINFDINFNSITNATAYHSLKVGGIVGDNEAPLINSINEGTLTGSKTFTTTVGTADYDIDVGGIVGKNNDTGIIENCINSGAITANSETSGIKIGGIAGNTEDLSTSIINNVYNCGTITATSGDRIRIGGIAGDGNGILNYGYNIGAISATKLGDKDPYIGSILGDFHTSNTNTTITNCYYNKVEGIFGAEGSDREGINPVNNLTQTQIINQLNSNVDTNNSTSSRIWYKITESNGKIKYNLPNA